MICLSGVDAEQDAGARVLQEAVQKIVRIKLQMGSSVSNEALEHWTGLGASRLTSSLLQHRIGLARVQGSRLDVVQEFTRDVAALSAEVPGLLTSADRDDTTDLDALLADAACYFGVQRDMVGQGEELFADAVVQC